jgi:hypothetical protein
MGVIAGQLAFEFQDNLDVRIRASVAEANMTSEEIDAAVKDALDRLGVRSNGAARARPCICEGGSMMLISAFAIDRRCARCGREPRP